MYPILKMKDNQQRSTLNDPDVGSSKQKFKGI